MRRRKLKSAKGSETHQTKQSDKDLSTQHAFKILNMAAFVLQDNRKTESTRGEGEVDCTVRQGLVYVSWEFLTLRLTCGSCARCMCTHMCAYRDQRSVISFFTDHSTAYFLRQSFLSKPGAHDEARLAG